MMDLFRHLRIHTKRKEISMKEKLKKYFKTFKKLKTWVQILIASVILIIIHSFVLH